MKRLESAPGREDAPSTATDLGRRTRSRPATWLGASALTRISLVHQTNDWLV